MKRNRNSKGRFQSEGNPRTKVIRVTPEEKELIEQIRAVDFIIDAVLPLLEELQKQQKKLGA